MARDGSGTYTRVSNTFTAPVAGQTISPTDADALWDELDLEITDSLSRTGKGGMSADLDMNNNDINEIKTAVFQGSTSGTTTVIATAIAGTTTLTLPAGGTLTGSSSAAIWYDNIPQNSKSAAYTTVLSDAQKHIFHPSADTTARIWTIDSNANVAYPIGTEITFVNQNAGGVITISITTDTMRLAGPGTTGSRTLAANGTAKALKVTATEWLISGTGLT